MADSGKNRLTYRDTGLDLDPLDGQKQWLTQARTD
jgi:hypothetical protein